MNMQTHKTLFPQNFMLCGLTGWCMEILFSAVKNVHHTDRRLMGQTSVWMFPIYGCAALIKPMYQLTGKLPALARGSIYCAAILTGEFISGSLLKKHGCCPWDYSHARFNIHGVIRLDYAPLWMGAGLLFERILGCHQNRTRY